LPEPKQLTKAAQLRRLCCGWRLEGSSQSLEVTVEQEGAVVVRPAAGAKGERSNMERNGDAIERAGGTMSVPASLID